LVNSLKSEFSFTRVVTDEVPVVPNNIYAVHASVKFSNANLTHLEVQGFDTEINKWVKIAVCPNIRSGDSDWKEYDCSMWIPPRITKVRPILAGGWVKDSDEGSAVSWFDDVRVSEVKEDFYTELDARVKPPEVEFKKLSASKYEVTVRGATKPFVLVQSESFNRLWVARTEDGRKIEAVPLYATINGYPIDQTGDFKLTVEFEAQRWFSWGLVISLSVLLLCGVYLVYAWRRKKAPRERAGKPTGGMRKLLDKAAAAVGRALARLRKAIEEPRRHKAFRGR
jgi:hypothetical protein